MQVKPELNSGKSDQMPLLHLLLMNAQGSAYEGLNLKSNPMSVGLLHKGVQATGRSQLNLKKGNVRHKTENKECGYDENSMRQENRKRMILLSDFRIPVQRRHRSQRGSCTRHSLSVILPVLRLTTHATPGNKHTDARQAAKFRRRTSKVKVQADTFTFVPLISLPFPPDVCSVPLSS
jgi:hypothetical protein